MGGNSSDKIKTLLTQTNAFDRCERYVYFDRIWQDTMTLKTCAELVHQYMLELNEKLSFIPEDKSGFVILTPDSVAGGLGILPVSFFVADRLGCQVSVWKEYADVKWGTSKIVGNRTRNNVCVVLQDVVDHGTTAVRIAHNIKEFNWKFILYLAVVANSSSETGVGRALKQVQEILGSEPAFRHILSVEELL
jgi:phosphoribosylpyrophosphate synthetase